MSDEAMCRHDLLRRRCEVCLAEGVDRLTQRLGEVEAEIRGWEDMVAVERNRTLEARAERDRLELAKENWRNAYDKEAATAGRLREELAEVREMLEYDARRIVAERDALARREHRECVTERRLKVAWLLLLEARDKINASRSRPGSPELSSECSNLSERISVFLAAPLVEPGGGE